MTRINCIPVAELHDKHLLAEYRELPRVFKLARRLPEDEVPKHYTLGTGHVKFFYDKLLYCLKRQYEIVLEMKNRGFSPKYDPKDLKATKSQFGGELPKSLWKNWVPTEADINLNRERINQRLKEMEKRNAEKNKP